jgi:uncharacterized membrane protein YdjX (TVP38/TMEM64 family)
MRTVRVDRKGNVVFAESVEEDRSFARRVVNVAAGDDGMSTAEYAIGTIAAAAFGAVLYTVVTGDGIVSALTGIVERALNTSV